MLGELLARFWPAGVWMVDLDRAVATWPEQHVVIGEQLSDPWPGWTRILLDPSSTPSANQRAILAACQREPRLQVVA